jgi:hypothetical protein
MTDVVSFETAQRLKEAGFPQPGKTGHTHWYDQSGFLIVISRGESGCPPGQILAMSPDDGISFLTVETEMTDWTFAPNTTDIMRHLPDMHLCFHSNKVGWSYWWDQEGSHSTFRIDASPNEVVAEVWLTLRSLAQAPF